MVDIIHRVGIEAPVSKVYAALSTIDGLAGWWTANTSGAADIGKTIETGYRSAAGPRIRLPTAKRRRPCCQPRRTPCSHRWIVTS